MTNNAIIQANHDYQHGAAGFYVVNRDSELAVAGPFLGRETAQASAEAINRTPPETPDLLIVVGVGT